MNSKPPSKPDEIVLYSSIDEQDAGPKYEARLGEVFVFKGIRLTAITTFGRICDGCHFKTGECFSNVMCGGHKHLIFATDETVIENVTRRLVEGKKNDND